MYRYEAAPAFWRSYRKLTPAEQQAAKRAWQVFKLNPFDPRREYSASPLLADFILPLPIFRFWSQDSS